MPLSFTLNKLLIWFIRYKYAIIFPAVVVEGPIVTVLTGLIASLGYLHFYVAYPVVVVADWLGDCIYFFVGRYSRERFIDKHGKRFGITQKRLLKVEQQFHDHKLKTLLFAKFSHGIGSVVWVAAGVMKYPTRKFMSFNLFTTAIKSLILLSIGYFFGYAYLKYRDYIDAFGLALALIVIAFYSYIIRKQFLD